MGEQAYQSYHGGDIDSVSLTNGTLSLNFPFLSYPQRGKLNLSFNLMYNNQAQHQGQLCLPAPAGCKWMWGYPSGGALPIEKSDVYVGWANQFGLVGQYITAKVDTYTQFYSNWSLQMADGSKHPLANLGTFTWTTNAQWCGADGVSGNTRCSTANGPLETLDATGWRLNGALNPCLVASGCTGGLGVGNMAVDPNGVLFTGNGTINATIQDPSGNEITSNSTTITDSLGRQISLPPTSRSSGNTSTSSCPVISGQPSAATAVLWAPPLYSNGTQQYVFCYASFPINLPATVNFGCSGPSTVTRLQSIVLPNGQGWQFQYSDLDSSTSCLGQESNFATLSQVTLPTGGTISYTYAYNGGLACQNSGRFVYQRTVNANDGSLPHTWTYTYNNVGQMGSTTIVTDPLGNDVMHTFGAGGGCSWYETQTQYYQGSHTSGTLLKTVDTSYNYSTAARDSRSPINVVPTIIQTLWPDSQTYQTTNSYDPGYSYTDYIGNTTDLLGNPNVGIYGKEIKEQAYDYPSGTSLLRTTNTSYAWQSPNPNYSNYLTNNLLNLPYSVQVKDSGGTQRAYTTYGYDESGLQSSGISEQKVAGESYPGNQTSVHRWLNGSTTGTSNCAAVTSGYLVTTKAYYDTGEVPTVTDPCGNQTNYQYSSTYYGAFVTKATNALGQFMSYAYDFNTGAVTSITDWNSQVATKNYDALTRLTSVSYPDGGSTTLCYTDTGGATCTQGSAPFAVVKTKAITASPVLNETSTFLFDGLGRTSQTQLNSDPSGTTYTLATYDALGRKSQVYNPTRCSSITANCNNETTWGYTTTNYDPLNRVTSVVEQDGSTVSTNYSAFPCTTVTDEAGNSRQSCVDGLGRMTSVLEDPGASPHLNYTTNYTYDALGNLTYVNQIGSTGGQPRTRTFQYDSLSELTSALNPESGTILYAYDADSNVITKTAPLPNQNLSATVTTTNTYDKLNRLTKKSYMDGNNSDPYTPTVQFGYDGVAIPSGCTIAPPGDPDALPVGRQTSMCDGSGGTSWTHDSRGRINQERRSIGASGVNHYVDYTYNLDGSLGVLQTPPMKSLRYTYNGAAEATKLVDATDNINFALNGTYAPPGELTGMTLGSATGFNGFTISNAYNDRLQPILRSATSPTATVSSECFDFHLGVAITSPSPCTFSRSTAGDNGNVYQIVNNRSSIRSQSFNYDALNRVANAQQTTGTQWGESYTIDAWANLTAIGSYNGKPHESLSTTANTNNQLLGFGYDAAGNMTSNGSVSYVYDAENRLVWTSGYRYIYDGHGERVEKCQAASATTACPTSGTTGTLYWRGTGSDTLAETDLAGNDQEEYLFFNGQRIARRDTTSLGVTIAVHYYFSDHLGSHGVVENQTGTTCEQDIDYYPYGGVENDYCGGSGVAQNYKFTGKERDSESGLDNFGKRYHGSSLGRFMTPDPIGIMKQKFVDPQQWNMYSYSRNNPLRFMDPTGMYTADCGSGVKNCEKQIQKIDKDIQDAAKSKNKDIANAAKAYGKLGDDNGVKVSVLTKVVDANGNTVPALTTAQAGTGGLSYNADAKTFKQATQVNIQAGLGGDELRAGVVHEGVHVEDRAAFANSITYGGEAGPGFFYDGSRNITGRQSERNAMGVENEFRRSVGMPEKNIDEMLSHPPYSNNPNIDKLLFGAFGDAQ